MLKHELPGSDDKDTVHDTFVAPPKWHWWTFLLRPTMATAYRCHNSASEVLFNLSIATPATVVTFHYDQTLYIIISPFYYDQILAAIYYLLIQTRHYFYQYTTCILRSNQYELTFILRPDPWYHNITFLLRPNTNNNILPPYSDHTVLLSIYYMYITIKSLLTFILRPNSWEINYPPIQTICHSNIIAFYYDQTLYSTILPCYCDRIQWSYGLPSYSDQTTVIVWWKGG